MRGIKEVYAFTVLKPNLKSSCWQSELLLEALRKNLFHEPLQASGEYGHLWRSLAYSCITLIFATFFTWPSHPCRFLLFSAHKSLIFGFEALLINPRWSTLEIFHLVTSVRTLYLNNITLTDTRG